MLHSSSFLYSRLDSVDRLIASVLFCQTKRVLHYQANLKFMVQVYIRIQILIQTWSQMWFQDPNLNSNLKGQISENSILRKIQISRDILPCVSTMSSDRTQMKIQCKGKLLQSATLWYNDSTSIISSIVAQLWLAWLSLVGCLGSNPGPIKIWLF